MFFIMMYQKKWVIAAFILHVLVCYKHYTLATITQVGYHIPIRQGDLSFHKWLCVIDTFLTFIVWYVSIIPHPPPFAFSRHASPAALDLGVLNKRQLQYTQQGHVVPWQNSMFAQADGWARRLPLLSSDLFSVHQIELLVSDAACQAFWQPDRNSWCYAVFNWADDSHVTLINRMGRSRSEAEFLCCCCCSLLIIHRQLNDTLAFITISA